MKLNKDKCESLHTGQTKPNVHFSNGERVKSVDEAKYLGCILNNKADLTKEVKARTANTMATLKKLDMFWRHSSCPERFKLQVLDAVCRAKLLYGLETAQLTQATIKTLDTFQLKGLRKILRMETTYVNRENSNDKVIQTANEKIQQQGGNKEIKLFSEVYKDCKLKLYEDILNSDESSPVKQSTMQMDTLKDTQFDKRRVGRPRLKWNSETSKEYWEATRSQRGGASRGES